MRRSSQDHPRLLQLQSSAQDQNLNRLMNRHEHQAMVGMPMSREACGVASCGSRLYVFGGWICSYSHF